MLDANGYTECFAATVTLVLKEFVFNVGLGKDLYTSSPSQQTQCHPPKAVSVTILKWKKYCLNLKISMWAKQIINDTTDIRLGISNCTLHYTQQCFFFHFFVSYTWISCCRGHVVLARCLLVQGYFPLSINFSLF